MPADRPFVRRLAPALAALALAVGCARAPNGDQAFARRYKAIMVEWKAEVERVAGTFDARIAPVPRAGRRAFLLGEMRNEAEMNERTLARLDGLGVPPEIVRGVVRASREMLAFLARSAREKGAALERRDRAESARLDAEFEREVVRLQSALVRERNAVARKGGVPEMSEASALEGLR